jgi:hypothetical protein
MKKKFMIGRCTKPIFPGSTTLFAGKPIEMRLTKEQQQALQQQYPDHVLIFKPLQDGGNVLFANLNT